MPNTPDYQEGSDSPCVMYNPNAISYAFSIPREMLIRLGMETGVITVDDTQAVDLIWRTPEQIGLRYTASDVPTMIVAQEVAYPGWQVDVNGMPAPLEPVGGLVGVTIDPTQVSSGETVDIRFYYVPILLFVGGAITIATCVIAALYLLDPFKARRSRRESASPTTTSDDLPAPESP
jgi:hypothetical protein